MNDPALFWGHCEPGESDLGKVSVDEAEPDIDSWNL